MGIITDGANMDRLLEIYFSATGRMGRLHFFLYGLLLGIIAYIPFLATNQYGLIGPLPDLSPIIWVLVAMVILIIWYCSFVITIKRFHDLNYNGWWSLLLLVPLINIVLGILLWFLPGTKGANRFGNPPI